MMKLLFFGVLLILFTGCQDSGICQSPDCSQECPEKPEAILQEDAVKTIELTETMTTQSGIAKKNKSLAYRFEAKKGHKLKLSTEADLCIWIFSPDNDLIDDLDIVFQENGFYMVQIAIPQGSTSFDLQMGLEFNIPIASNSIPKPNSNSSNSSPSIVRPDPKQTISNYYSYINNRQYSSAWEMLTSSHQQNRKSHPNGYSSFEEWWVKVARVESKNIAMVEVTENTAIVDFSYQYNMKKGKPLRNSVRFFLDWDDNQKKWRIAKTQLK